MTIHNDWIDDELDLSWEAEQDARRAALEKPLQVRFILEDGRPKGRVVEDRLGKARTKIVFPAREWAGAPPKDGEVLAVQVVHETKPGDPRRGVLFVQRDLPKIRSYTGAQYAKCTKGCAEPEGVAGHQAWTVRVILRNDARLRRERYPVCTKCGQMHELDAEWL